MEWEFPHKVLQNNPSLAGTLACRPAKKYLFGDASRFAAAPVHTSGENVVWRLWDAGHPESTMQRARIIREAPTFEELVSVLDPRPEGPRL